MEHRRTAAILYRCTFIYPNNVQANTGRLPPHISSAIVHKRKLIFQL